MRRALVLSGAGLALLIVSPPLCGLCALFGLLYLLRHHRACQVPVIVAVVLAAGGIIGGATGVLIGVLVLALPIGLVCLLPLRVDALIALVAYLRSRTKDRQAGMIRVSREQLDQLVKERHAEMVDRQYRADGTYDHIRETHRAWKRGVPHDETDPEYF